MTYSILIVDDDTAITESVQEYLTFLDYTVKSCSNADDAFKILEWFKADIILTDIMMQGMDGLELTRKVKDTYDIDVIAMTGYSVDYSYEEAIKAGANDFIFKPFRFEELKLRIKRVLEETKFKRERTQLLKRLEKLAITDALTGLYNSRHFFNQIKIEIKRYNRYSHPLSLLMLDIDFFKAYNDTWGHLEGDKVLARVGSVINTCMRSIDTAYRYGGEEFVIILPETKVHLACVVGERIKDRIASLVFEPEPGIKNSITVSVGVTDLIEGEGFNSFIKRADQALYKSKKTGRNKVTCGFAP